jgi:PAS domain S-box-containing protein
MTGNQQSLDQGNPLLDRLDVEMAVRAARLGIWEIDPDSWLITWDDRCRELCGAADELRLPFQQALRYIHPDDSQSVDDAVHRAISSTSSGDLDVTFRTVGTGDGWLHWVRFMGRCYTNTAGRPYKLAGVAQEVTKESVIRQQLEASERRFRSLIDEAPVATSLFVGPDLVIEQANEPMLKLWGKGAAPLGKPLIEALPELADQEFPVLLKNVFSTGTAFTGSGAPGNLVIDGVLKTFYFDFTYKPLFDQQGEVYAVMDMAVDVTDQVIARQQIEDSNKRLQQQEEQLRSLVENTPDIITRWDRERRLVFANSAFARKVGTDLSNLIGKTNEEIGQPGDIALAYTNTLQAVLDTGLPQDHYNVYPTEAANLFYYSRLVPEFGADGTVQTVLAIARDITELKRLENDLEQRVTNRTKALEDVNTDLRRSNENLEQFAYIASHDLQEPLRKIQQFSDLLRTRYADSTADELDYLQRMQTAASRMSLLIKDLLTFSRISTRQAPAAPVSLNEAVEQALENLTVAIEETNARIDVGDLPVTEGDESQLVQLFQNLLSNAIKFRRPDVSPHITIRSRCLPASELPATLNLPRVVAFYHQIEVADNGIGFDEKYVDRIFQVFQRLHGKNEFAGTGVGLAICQKVVTNHGGTITANSQPGTGATFTVYLPLS